MNGMKRAQAAMEYLMTYGWALLVIVLVLGALIYLGVLNPQGRMQDMCNLPIGFGCEVAGLSTNGTLYLKVTNQQATQLTGLGIDCDGVNGLVDKKTLNPGDFAIFQCEIFPSTSPRNIGDFVNGDMTIKFDSGVPGQLKSIKGTYSAKVSIEE